MKTMLILIAALFATFPAFTADQPARTYTAEVAGIMCSACSARVREAFSRLEGVTQVKVKKSDQAGVGVVEITSTSARLTKEAAVKALGDGASSYNILNFKLTGS